MFRPFMASLSSLFCVTGLHEEDVHSEAARVVWKEKVPSKATLDHQILFTSPYSHVMSASQNKGTFHGL